MGAKFAVVTATTPAVLDGWIETDLPPGRYPIVSENEETGALIVNGGGSVVSTNRHEPTVTVEG